MVHQLESIYRDVAKIAKRDEDDNDEDVPVCIVQEVECHSQHMMPKIYKELKVL